MVTITNRPREALQTLIKNQLGWVGRREIREVDAILLKAKEPGGAKLKVSSGPRNINRGKLIDWPNQPISVVANMVEVNFGKPVVDQTGLANLYDITIDGAWGTSEKANLDLLETMLSSQLGLELVPSREPIEMLVVEKVK